MAIKILENAVFWCGIAHLALGAGSIGIPRAMEWKSHLATLNPLIRQMFWTYAGYVLFVNIAFGILSAFGGRELLNGSFLAKGITLFIGLYWLTRIVIQFFYFDRSQAPKGMIYRLAEGVLVALFVLFAATYLIAFCVNTAWS